MGDFITPSQLASYLQSDVDTSSATLAITQAEALVRGYCRQTITADTSTALLPIQVGGDGYFVLLPESPVTAVDTVEVSGVAYVDGVDFSWDGASQTVRLAVVEYDDTVQFRPTAPLAEVTYDHGYATPPGDVVAVVLSLAGRVFDNPRGMRSESVEGYTYTRGGDGDDILGVSLSKSEMKILDRYRTRARSVTVS